MGVYMSGGVYIYSVTHVKIIISYILIPIL